MNWLKTTLLNSNFWLNKSSYKKEQSNLSVTIVIPAWNEQEFIRDTLESILSQSYKCNVIVVDDNSTDNTPNIVKEYPSVMLLRTEKNQGSKSKALNCAIPFVETDIFICVDADTILDEDAVEKLVMAFNDENTVIACGFVTSKANKNVWQSGRYGEYLVGQCAVKSAQQNGNFVLVASGCFFGIRTWFLQENNFPTRTLAEDMDLTWQAIEKGYRITFVEDAYCSVSDPDTCYLYDKQVSRWYRGFFQNIKERNFNLFKNNFKLGIVVYSYMIMNFIGMPTIVLSLFYVASISQALFFTLLMWFGISFILVIYSSYYQIGNQLLNPKHYFNALLISFYTYFIFIRSAIQELILKDKLDTWIKGH